MKTQVELDKLITQWTNDPIWDLEGTEGFEEYRDHLLTVSRRQKEKWRNEDRERAMRKARELGCPANIALAQYVITLEKRIEQLENAIVGI